MTGISTGIFCVTFQDWYFLLLAYSGTDTLYVELVYSHTHTDIQKGWYAGMNY